MSKKNKAKNVIVSILVGLFIVSGTLVAATSKVYAYEVKNNYGFSENNIDVLKENKNVYKAFGFFTKTLSNKDEIKSYEGSEIEITSGRKPEKIKEIILSNQYADKNNYQLGDSFLVDKDEYKVTGLYDDDLSNKTIGYILADNFDELAYDSLVVYLKTENDVKEVLSESEEELKEIRKQEVIDFKNEQIDQLSDKYNLIKENADSLKQEADKQFSDAEKKINESKAQIADYQTQLDEANKLLIDGKKTLDEAEDKLNSGYSQLKAAKNELEEYKRQFKQKLDEYGVKENELEDLLAQAENTFKKYGYTIEFIKCNLNIINHLDEYTGKLIELIDKAIEILKNKDKDKENFSCWREELEKIWEEINYYFNKIKDFISHCILEKTIKALEKIKDCLQGFQSTINELQQLANLEKTIEEIKEAISARELIKSNEELYEKKYNEYLSGKKQYEEGLQEYNKKLDEYNEANKIFLSKKKELDNGITKFNKEKDEYDKKMRDLDSQLSDIDNDRETLKDEINNIDIKWEYSDCHGSVRAFIPVALYVGAGTLTAALGFMLYKGLKNERPKVTS